MNISLERSKNIVAAMSAVREAIGPTATVDGLDAAKAVLKNLALRRDLFPETDFPWPTADQENVMYCIYRGEGGDTALYLDLLNQGSAGAPHDHGNSWAIVVAMEGQERHNLFRRADAGTGVGRADLQPAGQIDIGPGEAVSLLPGGIHSISAIGSARLMMMHCYAHPFDAQDARLEFDLSSGTCAFGTAATGEIRDVALHADMVRP